MFEEDNLSPFMRAVERGDTPFTIAGPASRSVTAAYGTSPGNHEYVSPLIGEPMQDTWSVKRTDLAVRRTRELQETWTGYADDEEMIPEVRDIFRDAAARLEAIILLFQPQPQKAPY